MNELSKKIGEETISQHADAAVPTNTSANFVSRRRLVQAGLAATPVVLALSGRSAMAGNSSGSSNSTTATCLSHAAWYSANPKGKSVSTSRTPRSSGSPGFSPIKWKPCETGATFPHITRWPTDCIPFKTLKVSVVQQVFNSFGRVIGTKTVIESIGFDNTKCREYTGLSYRLPTGLFGSLQDAGWNSGDKLSWLDGSRSCSKILIDEADRDTLAAHVCAAYLNAKLAEEGRADKFPISSADVKLCYTNNTLGGNQVSDADLLAFFKQTCVWRACAQPASSLAPAVMSSASCSMARTKRWSSHPIQVTC